jgi:hypothetical protein
MKIQLNLIIIPLTVVSHVVHKVSVSVTLWIVEVY